MHWLTMHFFSFLWLVTLHWPVVLYTVFLDTLLYLWPIIHWMLCEWELAAPVTVTVSSKDFQWTLMSLKRGQKLLHAFMLWKNKCLLCFVAASIRLLWRLKWIKLPWCGCIIVGFCLFSPYTSLQLQNINTSLCAHRKALLRLLGCHYWVQFLIDTSVATSLPLPIVNCFL